MQQVGYIQTSSHYFLRIDLQAFPIKFTRENNSVVKHT